MAGVPDEAMTLDAKAKADIQAACLWCRGSGFNGACEQCAAFARVLEAERARCTEVLDRYAERSRQRFEEHRKEAMTNGGSS